ncbi:MAG: hypothetical protein P0120_04680 [Nitrospira sp.]|nr:hypothetical protein [Nitrospira sp.]
MEAGKHTIVIVLDLGFDADGFGRGGIGRLSVDGKEGDKKPMKNTIPSIL